MFAYLESPLKHLLEHSHGTAPGIRVMRMSALGVLQLPLSAPTLLFGLFAVFSLFTKEKPSHNSHRSSGHSVLKLKCAEKLIKTIV